MYIKYYKGDGVWGLSEAVDATFLGARCFEEIVGDRSYREMVETADLPYFDKIVWSPNLDPSSTSHLIRWITFCDPGEPDLIRMIITDKDAYIVNDVGQTVEVLRGPGD